MCNPRFSVLLLAQRLQEMAQFRFDFARTGNGVGNLLAHQLAIAFAQPVHDRLQGGFTQVQARLGENVLFATFNPRRFKAGSS